MPERFELFVCNPDIGCHFVTQVQVFDKGKAGLKRLLFEGLFSCENLHTRVGFLNISRVLKRRISVMLSQRLFKNE